MRLSLHSSAHSIVWGDYQWCEVGLHERDSQSVVVCGHCRHPAAMLNIGARLRDPSYHSRLKGASPVLALPALYGVDITRAPARSMTSPVGREMRAQTGLSRGSRLRYHMPAYRIAVHFCWQDPSRHPRGKRRGARESEEGSELLVPLAA